jgi:predicted HicB family RNase H-like nuclease
VNKTMTTPSEQIQQGGSQTLKPYKGYTAHLDIDIPANLLVGHVLGMTDMISFQGRTPKEAEDGFHQAVDDYLAYCEELGVKPEKSFSGRLLFRVKPEQHRAIYQAAQLAGKSVNAWMADILVAAAEEVCRATALSSQRETASSTLAPEQALAAAALPALSAFNWEFAKLSQGHLTLAAVEHALETNPLLVTAWDAAIGMLGQLGHSSESQVVAAAIAGVATEPPATPEDQGTSSRPRHSSKSRQIERPKTSK